MAAGYIEPLVHTGQNKQERVNSAFRETMDDSDQQGNLVNELLLILYSDGYLDDDTDPNYERLISVLQKAGLSLDEHGFLMSTEKPITESNREHMLTTMIRESDMNHPQEPDIDRPQKRGTRRVLISHSEIDVEVAGEIARFVELVCRLEKGQILCTSVADYGLEPGEDWIHALRRAIQDGDVIIFLISEDFLSSDFCGFELGAAWMARDELQRFPMRFPNVGAERLGTLPGSWHCPSISDNILSLLVDRIVQRCGLQQPPAKSVTSELGRTMRNLKSIWKIV